MLTCHLMPPPDADLPFDACCPTLATPCNATRCFIARVAADGAHKPDCNEKTLLAFWPYLRPGGLYFIEDVVTGGDKAGQFHEGAAMSRPGRSRLLHDHSWLQPATRAIFTENDVLLADTTVGHRSFQALQRAVPPKWFSDRVDHNTHIIVIRKRR